MKIGINLKESEFDIVELEDIVSNYPEGFEVGYLKLNPDRYPVVVSETFAEEAIKRLGKHALMIDVEHGKYTVIGDDRSLFDYGERIAVWGNAYVVRKQFYTNTGLTAKEIIDVVADLDEEGEFPSDKYLAVAIEFNK